MSTDFEQRAFCPDCQREFEADRKYCPEDGALLLTYDVVDVVRNDPLVGSVLDDRFRIDEPLSEGGMGKVYRGSQMGIDREVAIKVLTSQMSEGDSTVRRFFREARTLSNFTHPNIVNFIDFGQDAERRALYLVMELIEGCGLDRLLDRGRLDVEVAVEIALQLCAALSDPHEYGFVHRDLKPANVMLLPLSDGSLQVKLVDFGIAGAVERGTKVTKTGQVVGTPEYMAPEQAEDSEVTPASDIYSVGTLVYHMLAGRPMFSADSDLNLIFKHLRGEPPKLSALEHSDELPPELFELFPKLVAKHPAERPDSILEVRNEFRAIARNSSISEIELDPTRPVEEALAPYVTPVDRKSGGGSTESDVDPHAETRVDSSDALAEDVPDDGSDLEERTSVGFGPRVSNEGDDDGEDPGRQTVQTAGASMEIGEEVDSASEAAERDTMAQLTGSSDVTAGESETGEREARDGPSSDSDDEERDERDEEFDAGEGPSRMTAEIRAPDEGREDPTAPGDRGDMPPADRAANRYGDWIAMAAVVLVSASGGAVTAWWVGTDVIPLPASVTDWLDRAGAAAEPGGSKPGVGARGEAPEAETPRKSAVTAPWEGPHVGRASRLPRPVCQLARNSCRVETSRGAALRIVDAPASPDPVAASTDGGESRSATPKVAVEHERAPPDPQPRREPEQTTDEGPDEDTDREPANAEPQSGTSDPSTEKKPSSEPAGSAGSSSEEPSPKPDAPPRDASSGDAGP